MKRKIKVLAALCCFFYATQTEAIEFTMQTSPYDCRNAVVEADTVWVATSGGLAKYSTDGTLLKIFTAADGMSATPVFDIAKDSKGNKWLVTARYINKFDGKTFTEYKTTYYCTSGVNIGVDGSDNVYYTSTPGIAKISNGTTSTLSPSSYVMNLMIKKNGTAVYKTSTSVVKTNDGTAEATLPSTLPTGAYIWNINFDINGVPYSYITVASDRTKNGLYHHDGTDWVQDSWAKQSNIFICDKDNDYVCYANDSVFVYKGKSTIALKEKLNHTKTPWGASITINKLITTNNALWILTSYGLLKYDGTTVSKFIPTAIPSGNIWSIAIDSSAKKWVSSDYQIASYENNSWTASSVYLQKAKIVVDRKNVKWFAGIGGVASYDNTSWTSFNTTNTPSMGTNNYRCVCVDKNNKKWFGTYDKGVFTFDGTTWTALPTTGLVNLCINDLTVDKNGTLWCATNTGTAKFENNQWTTINTSAAFVVFIDSKGIIWTGNERGIKRFDGTTWTTIKDYYTPQSLQSHFLVGFGDVNIMSFAEDKNGIIWFGSRTQSDVGNYFYFDGVNYINPEPVTVSVAASVYSIAIEKDNTLWLSGLGCTVLKNTVTTQNPQPTLVSVSPTFVTLSNNTGTFQINGTGAWSATSSDTWLTVSPATGTGAASVTITAQPFTGTGLRMGTITVSDVLKANHEITVTQNAEGVTVIDNPSVESLTVYPNPSQSSISVKCNDEVESILVYNSTGALVASGANVSFISIEFLPKGIYSIKAKLVTGKTITTSIIKN